MEEKQIIRLFFERSEHAIAKLSERYGRLCKSLSCRILGNEQDAEECVNDTYLAVWDTIPPEQSAFFNTSNAKGRKNRSVYWTGCCCVSIYSDCCDGSG